MIFALQILTAVIAPLVFLIGLIKPKWILFWMREPDRLWASSVGLVIFMAGFTGYSELRVRHRAMAQGEHSMPRDSERMNELQLDRR